MTIATAAKGNNNIPTKMYTTIRKNLLSRILKNLRKYYNTRLKKGNKN